MVGLHGPQLSTCNVQSLITPKLSPHAPDSKPEMLQLISTLVKPLFLSTSP